MTPFSDEFKRNIWKSSITNTTHEQEIKKKKGKKITLNFIQLTEQF